MACAARAAAQPTLAADEAPSGRVMLTISGKIDPRYPRGSVDLDRAMIERVGVKQIRTKTLWTQGESTFTGVLMRDLLAAVGAHGEIVRGTALNDYQVDIKISDFHSGDVLLAMDINGQPMSVREKGPLWIIYPWNQFDLRDDSPRFSSIWQLRYLEIR